MGRAALLLATAFLYSSAFADARIEICFNYGCAVRVPVVFDAGELGGIEAALAHAATPEDEREAVSRVIGAMYRIAGGQTPVFADQAGNLLDAGAHGRMDCIDHSTTTTAMLRLIESRGWLRFHEVREPARRTRFITQHFSAVIEEPVAVDHEERGVSFAVDSWFVSHGEPAVVIPLSDWLRGGGPSVN